MTYSASALGTEFNDFLFAPIGQDRNDVPLSVLSALARLGIDPWQEAAELARLPRETATQRLASSIASLPDGASAYLEGETVAARLIARLPSRTDSQTVSRGAPDLGDATKLRFGLWMYAVLIVVMVAAQWIAASGQTPGHVEDTHAAVSGTYIPQTPPPSSGK
jgi:hypothetical protein